MYKMNPSVVRRFVFTAVGVGVAGGIGINWIHRSTQKSVAAESFAQDAVEKFIANEKAVQLLGGGPITIRGFNLQELYQQRESLELKTTVQIKGNMKYGELFVLSNRENVEDKFMLQSVMLQFKKRGNLETIWIYPEDGEMKADEKENYKINNKESEEMPS